MQLTLQPILGAATHGSFDDTGARRAGLEAFADAVVHGVPYPVMQAQAIACSATLKAIERSATWHTEMRVP